MATNKDKHLLEQNGVFTLMKGEGIAAACPYRPPVFMQGKLEGSGGLVDMQCNSVCTHFCVYKRGKKDILDPKTELAEVRITCGCEPISEELPVKKVTKLAINKGTKPS